MLELRSLLKSPNGLKRRLGLSVVPLRSTYYFVAIQSLSMLILTKENKKNNVFELKERFLSIFAPRYLTPSVGYSLLPHNFVINHLQISFA